MKKPNKARSRKWQELKLITAEDWNIFADQRKDALNRAVELLEITREHILASPFYDADTFPSKFPIQNYINSVVGHRALNDTEVKYFRRSMTALTAVVPLKLPENFILMDTLCHQVAVLLMNQRHQFAADEEEMKLRDLGIDPQKMTEDMASAAETTDVESVMDAVLSGNTTYDKDAAFVGSDMAYTPDDVEVVSLDELSERQATGQAQ